MLSDTKYRTFKERWLSGLKRLPRKQLSQEIGIVGSNPTLSSTLLASGYTMNARWILLLILSCTSSSLLGMTYDNRFFPLLDKPIRRHENPGFFFRLQPFVMFAHDSSIREEEFDDENSHLFDMEGGLYYSSLHDSIKLSGKSSELLVHPDLLLRCRNLWWSRPGRLDSAGLALRWYYSLTNHWEIGGSSLLMGARSRFTTFLRTPGDIVLTPGDKSDIQTSQSRFMDLAGIKSFLWTKFGVGDTDLYLRFGAHKDYFLRCKTLDAGIKLGMIAPTGVQHELDNPASLPFGGNGHWGLYFDGAVDSELKDDLFAGFNLRFIHRFRDTKSIRVPLLKQGIADRTDSTSVSDSSDGTRDFKNLPLSFAPHIKRVRVDSGFTFVFSPYVGFGDLRDGFGVQIGYTLILHNHDRLSPREDDEFPLIDRELFQHRSEWNREYVTVSLMYDLAKDREYRGRAPLLSLDVDIPVDILASKQSFKTYAVSLRIEWDLW